MKHESMYLLFSSSYHFTFYLSYFSVIIEENNWPLKGGDEENGSTSASESGEGPIKDEEEESSGNYFVTETESSYNGYGVDYSTISYQGQ